MQNAEPVTPRPASTVLLLRDAPGAGLEVFMVERHHKMSFAAAARVFPGGRVDDADVELTATPGETFLVAAIRETFEESGVFLARPRGDSALISPDRLAGLQAARPAVKAGEMKFVDLLNDEDLTLAADLLVPFAHWITPVVYPKRYDTHFFLAHAPEDHIAEHDGHESVDSLWISPARALSDADEGRGKLEFATRLNLEKLARHSDTEAAVAAAHAAKIVTVLPVLSGPEPNALPSFPPKRTTAAASL